MADESAEQFFWCLRHKRVETSDRCGSELLMGPYGSAEEAQGYADTAKTRNDAWDADDERWSGS